MSRFVPVLALGLLLGLAGSAAAQGATPVCGDGVREGLEVCDGEQADGCLVACRADCTCDCAVDDIVMGPLSLWPTFALQLRVGNPEREWSPVQMARDGLRILVGDVHGMGTEIVLPPGQGWRTIASNGGFSWRGSVQGIRRVVATPRAGYWRVTIRGWKVTDADDLTTRGLWIAVATGQVCAVKRFH